LVERLWASPRKRIGRALHERRHLNRIVAGRRIYDRRGVFLTFAAKKVMRDDAPLVTVKRAFAAGESFAVMVAALATDSRVARSDATSKVVGGALEVRPSLRLRYSYDERIEDGFYAASAIAKVRGWIEDPAAWIGD